MSGYPTAGATLSGIVLLAAVGLASCQTLQHSSLPADVHTAMVDRIDPAAVTIWNLASRTMNEASGSRRGRMDDAAWGELVTASHTLAEAAHRLAEAESLRVGAHNEALQGFASAAEIQSRIDADPTAFRKLAREAEEHAIRLATAAQAQDLLRSQALTRNLYDNCRACHSRYWEANAPAK